MPPAGQLLSLFFFKLVALPLKNAVISRQYQQGQQKQVYLIVNTPKLFKSEYVGKLEETLEQQLGEPIDLHVRSIMTVESTSEGYIKEPLRMVGAD